MGPNIVVKSSQVSMRKENPRQTIYTDTKAEAHLEPLRTRTAVVNEG